MADSIDKGTPLHSILMVALKTKFDGNCLDEIMEIIQTHKYPIVAAEVVLGISQEPKLPPYGWEVKDKGYPGCMLVGYNKWADHHSKVRYREIIQPTERWRIPNSLEVEVLVDQETGVVKDKDELRALGYIHQYDDGFNSDEDLYEYFHKVEVITAMPYVRHSCCSVTNWLKWGDVCTDKPNHGKDPQDEYVLKEFSNFTIHSSDERPKLIDNHDYNIWGYAGIRAPDFTVEVADEPNGVIPMEDMAPLPGLCPDDASEPDA